MMTRKEPRFKKGQFVTVQGNLDIIYFVSHDSWGNTGYSYGLYNLREVANDNDDDWPWMVE